MYRETDLEDSSFLSKDDVSILSQSHIREAKVRTNRLCGCEHVRVIFITGHTEILLIVAHGDGFELCRLEGTRGFDDNVSVPLRECTHFRDETHGTFRNKLRRVILQREVVEHFREEVRQWKELKEAQNAKND